MQYVEFFLMEAFTICWSKIMFITIMLLKKSPYGVVVQWLRIWFLNVDLKN